MARWKLMAPHYMNLVNGADWEYVENSGGKHRRHRFLVPRMLNPNDPGDWNSRWGQRSSNNIVGNEEGEIIVALPGKGEGSDYEFLGDPTPDMMPIDDEARELSASFETRWSYRPDQAESSFSQSLVDGFREAMETSRQPETVKIEGLDAVLATLAQTQKLIVESLGASHARRA